MKEDVNGGCAPGKVAERDPKPPPLRVLIADAHALVRRGLREILAEAFPQAQFGESENAKETVALIQSQPWVAVVLGLDMPGRSGLDVLKDLKASGVKAPILALSFHSEDQYGLRALKAGAAGYLSKESAPEQFVSAVQCVRTGHTYISNSLAEKLAGKGRGSRGAESMANRLSDRELEVLELIGSGKTIKEIGILLALSGKTISTYRRRLLAKLSMKSNGDLMRFAIEEHLVE